MKTRRLLQILFFAAVVTSLVPLNDATAQEPQFLFKWGSAGSGDGQFGRIATGDGPLGMAIDQAGDVYVADTLNHRIQKFTSTGSFITKWGSHGSGEGQFNRPRGIAIDQSGDVYVADQWNRRIQKFTRTGSFIMKWGSYGSGDGEFNYPADIALDGSGNIYVADLYNNRVQKFTADGTFITKWGYSSLTELMVIAIDSLNNVYANFYYPQNNLVKFTSDGTFIKKMEGFAYSDGIAVDSDKHIIYLAETHNHRVQVLSTDLVSLGEWGSFGSADGQFYYPSDIAIGPSGNIYVLDNWNYRVQVFEPWIPTIIEGQIVAGPNGHFYQAIASPGISWESANYAANSSSLCGKAGHLATTTSKEENNFVNSLRAAFVSANGGNPQYWIGAFQANKNQEPGGNWMWINNEGSIPGSNIGPVFSNWAAGEPNNAGGVEDHVTLGRFFDGSLWNDEGSLPGSIGGYIVEFDGCNTAPTIHCPTSAALEATSPDGAAATLTVVVGDAEGDALEVKWTIDGTLYQTDPVPSGGASTAANVSFTALFGLGGHEISVSVSDGTADPVSCQASLSVVDTTPPTILCPANISLACSPELLVPVSFAATATDLADPAPVVTYSQAPGSGFAVGTTVINAKATDASGNQSTCSFTVTRGALDFEGFLSPLGGADASGGSFADPLRTFKLGSTIPIKFKADCGGSPILTGVHTLQTIKWGSATSSDPAIDATPTDAASSGNQFRLTDDQWHFNLDTKATGMTAGVWEIVATLSDGSQHRAWVQIK